MTTKRIVTIAVGIVSALLLAAAPRAQTPTVAPGIPSHPAAPAQRPAGAPSLPAAPGTETPAAAPGQMPRAYPSGAQTPTARPPRFDELVRADFFAGFAGNAERLARGMKMCEEALAVDSDHADALVWHGAGLMFLAGEAARQGDRETAAARARRGRAEIDRANQVAPDSLSVMLVRAVTLNASAPNVSDPIVARRMQQAAVVGFERALAIQEPTLSQLSEHSRGELLAGLAEGWSRLGEKERSRTYLERIVRELPSTRYQARARQWLEDGPAAGPLTCLTCHRS